MQFFFCSVTDHLLILQASSQRISRHITNIFRSIQHVATGNCAAHLQREEALGALGRPLGEAIRIEDAHQHLAPLLDRLQRRRRRGVHVVLDGLDLAEDLGGDPANLPNGSDAGRLSDWSE